MSWQDNAKCNNIEDPDVFFPPRDKELYKEISDKAKAICFGRDGKAPCPVKVQCLVYATDADEEFGIWGGMSPRERGALRRKAKKAGKSVEDYLTK